MKRTLLLGLFSLFVFNESIAAEPIKFEITSQVICQAFVKGMTTKPNDAVESEDTAVDSWMTRQLTPAQKKVLTSDTCDVNFHNFLRISSRIAFLIGLVVNEVFLQDDSSKKVKDFLISGDIRAKYAIQFVTIKSLEAILEKQMATEQAVMVGAQAIVMIAQEKVENRQN